MHVIQICENIFQSFNLDEGAKNIPVQTIKKCVHYSNTLMQVSTCRSDQIILWKIHSTSYYMYYLVSIIDYQKV